MKITALLKSKVRWFFVVSFGFYFACLMVAAEEPLPWFNDGIFDVQLKLYAWGKFGWWIVNKKTRCCESVFTVTFHE